MSSRAISLPFSFDARGGVSYSEDPKKIIQDKIVLVIMTLMGERVMRPSFGTSARSKVFENISSAGIAVEQAVSTGFSKWLPYLNLLNVGVATNADGVMSIDVQYSYGAGSTPEVVSVKTSVLDQLGNLIAEVPNGNQ